MVWALDYTPMTNGILSIVKKHWHIVSDIPGCKDFPLIGLRKKESLRYHLVKAMLPDTERRNLATPAGHTRYGRCSVCFLPWETKFIEFPEFGYIHTLKQLTNCNTCMCIYMATCICKKRYIGSTCHKIKLRIQVCVMFEG